MLRHKIKYEDFDGDEIEEDFYFNLTETELIELEVEHKEGLYHWLDKMVKMEDRKEMWQEFKRIILLAYGEKSSDGKRFVKTDEIRQNFEQHAAFNTLMIDLTTNEDSAATFIKGVIPAKLVERMAEITADEEKQIQEKKIKEAQSAAVAAAKAERALTEPNTPTNP